MPITLSKDQFIFHLRKALKALYDPSVLLNSPLIDWLEIDKNGGVAAALRRRLNEAIDQLRPEQDEPQGLKSWRVYHVLHQRYTLQFPQHKAAQNIGIGDRQMQREEKIAIDVLGDYLWRTTGLEKKANASVIPSINDPVVQTTQSVPQSVIEPQANLENFAALVDGDPIQATDIASLLEDVNDTLRPVAKVCKVNFEKAFEAQTIEISQKPFARRSLLRQGLLMLINQLMEYTRGGSLRLSYSFLKDAGGVILEAVPGNDQPAPVLSLDRLQPADALIRISNCSLHFDKLPDGLDIRVLLRVEFNLQEQITILFIDDHDDTLRLYRHYLEGSRYCFAGANTPGDGFVQAQDISPGVIFLDVMMPESDGWQVLGQLRLHPQTQNIPVVVCSILPQASLALALGAAEFIKKPISRPALIAVLDRLLSQSLPGSG